MLMLRLIRLNEKKTLFKESFRENKIETLRRKTFVWIFQVLEKKRAKLKNPYLGSSELQMLSIEEVEASLRQLTANLPSAAPSLGGATVQSAAQSGWVTNTQFLGSISLTLSHILPFAPHIFPKAQVTSNKNAHNFRRHFHAHFLMLLHLAWSIFWSVSLRNHFPLSRNSSTANQKLPFQCF